MNRLQKWVALWVACFALPAWSMGAGEESILTVRIINHTQSTLSFMGITNMRPGNTFKLAVPEVLPGGATTVIATASSVAGVSAKLNFRDQHGHSNALEIVDPNQLDSKQYSKFVMNNPRFVSFVREQRLNTRTSPRHLAWSTVTVEIQDKLGHVDYKL